MQATERDARNMNEAKQRGVCKKKTRNTGKAINKGEMHAARVRQKRWMYARGMQTTRGRQATRDGCKQHE